MSKSTAIFIAILSSFAFLLIGINLGKKIERNLSATPQPAITPPTGVSQPTILPPTITTAPTVAACSTQGGACGVGFAGIPLGICCEGYKCKESGNPDQGGTCVADETKLELIQGTTSLTDNSCAVTFSYPGSYIRSATSREGSQLLVQQGNPDSVIALTCMQKLPRPPVSSENIEAITVDGVAATLYHDKTQSGTGRDEIIVKHPTTGLELILAAPPDALQTILPTFRFLQ